MTAHGPRWTGEVRLVEEHLKDPLRWKKPRRIFVNSMSDLFHEKLTDDQIVRIFGVMAAAPQHTFQILTKRAERMLVWFNATFGLENTGVTVLREAERHGVLWDSRGNDPWKYNRGKSTHRLADRRPWRWPLPNLHLGVSTEDQETADERIPLLLQCPASIHWVSYEPALGPVNFAAARAKTPPRPSELWPPVIAWLVVGGESGPGARPFHISWARDVIKQCEGTATRVFVKQLGRHPGMNVTVGHQRLGWQELPLLNRKGNDMDEWPVDLRVRQVVEETL
jgi:protein gp37